MGWFLIALLFVPFAVAICAWFAPVRAGQALTVTTGVACFGGSVALVGRDSPTTAMSGWLRADPLSVVFLLAVTFLYALSALFAIGYLDAGAHRPSQYSRRLFAGLNLFCWSMAMATVVNGLALLWVAIEVTTVVSALLVAIDDTDGATEAAWKYVLIASMGLGIALLATIVMYYAGSEVFGGAYELFYPKLLGSAAHFPHAIVRLSFLLAVLGFGTKMGLVPVHTWLPDAHSEAPTPVSALLSGALLAVSFYAILRYFQITVRAVGPDFPRNVLLAFGLASLLLAALYLASQRDLKRLFAYSSVEHMGILAIGMSFAAPIAIVGVLLHVLAHAAAKGTAFFGAGSFLRKFGTKDVIGLSGGIDSLPWSGPLLVGAVLGLCAAPPGGIFRSEFLIVSGGLSDPADVVAAVLVVLVTLASIALMYFGTLTTTGPPADPVPRGETSWMMVAAMCVGLAGLVLLGIHPPGSLSQLLSHAAAQLGSGK
ncbi:proton-conducting transporter transmembrane domain-containing protein [Sinomonas sp.]|uniref:proton-conducting transporter transmembrane domain-containing protein n=1 Tax=Sinomonas sp. TaxID=1914986 RepID=UPI002FE3E454